MGFVPHPCPGPKGEKHEKSRTLIPAPSAESQPGMGSIWDLGTGY